MTNQLKHIANVKVGSVKGNSRIYPQLRLPSQYADLAGKKASIYEMSRSGEDVAFVVSFSSPGSVAAYHGASEPERRNDAEKPCRDFNKSGS